MGGRKKIVTISIKNRKPVPVEWSYKKSSGGRGQPAWEEIFDIKPDSGLLQPEEIQWITISFSPNSEKGYDQKLALKIKDNPHKKVINVKGHGDALKLDVSNEEIVLVRFYRTGKKA